MHMQTSRCSGGVSQGVPRDAPGVREGVHVAWVRFSDRPPTCGAPSGPRGEARKPWAPLQEAGAQMTRLISHTRPKLSTASAGVVCRHIGVRGGRANMLDGAAPP